MPFPKSGPSGDPRASFAGTHSHLALGAKLDFAKRTLPAHRKTTPFANVDRAVLLARAAPLLTANENTKSIGANFRLQVTTRLQKSRQ